MSNLPTFARRIMHLSAADVIGALCGRRRRIDASGLVVSPTLESVTTRARRVVALQNAVECVRRGASINTVLDEFPPEIVDSEVVINLSFAAWLRDRRPVEAILDIGGGLNSRPLSGVLADRCGTVWMCVSERPPEIEIASPTITRTGIADEVFSDGRRFSAVAGLGKRDWNCGGGNTSAPTALKERIIEAVDRVDGKGALFMASEMPAADLEDALEHLGRHAFIFEVRAYCVDASGWRSIDSATILQSEIQRRSRGIVTVCGERVR